MNIWHHMCVCMCKLGHNRLGKRWNTSAHGLRGLIISPSLFSSIYTSDSFKNTIGNTVFWIAIYRLLFKYLGSVRFVSYLWTKSHNQQDCIYLIKNTIKQLTVAINLYSMENTKEVNGLFTSIIQNILFYVQHNKETHTGLGQLEGK